MSEKEFKKIIFNYLMKKFDLIISDNEYELIKEKDKLVSIISKGNDDGIEWEFLIEFKPISIFDINEDCAINSIYNDNLNHRLNINKINWTPNWQYNY